MTENSEKRFVITLDELKQLCIQKTSPEKRIEIEISVLSRPYREPGKSFIETLKTWLIELIRLADEMSKPEERKRKG